MEEVAKRAVNERTKRAYWEIAWALGNGEGCRFIWNPSGCNYFKKEEAADGYFYFGPMGIDDKGEITTGSGGMLVGYKHEFGQRGLAFKQNIPSKFVTSGQFGLRQDITFRAAVLRMREITKAGKGNYEKYDYQPAFKKLSNIEFDEDTGDQQITSSRDI